ncbi:MAG: phosphomannomutase/phosphoglucomutase [Gammaproteobacteria bacterium]|jgi:phosphomannomutase/phosphoglucomutase
MARLTVPKSLNKQRRELTKFWLNYRRPVIAVVVVLAVLGAGALGWELLQGSIEESEQRETNTLASGAAKDVQAKLDEQLEGIDKQLDLAALAKLLMSEDEEALRAQETSIAAAMQGVLGLRILPRLDDRKPDYAATPPITYASLGMMRAAAQDGESPRPEVLLFGEAEQHIAVVRALPNADDKSIVGFVLIGLDVKPIVATFARVQSGATYVELSQGSGKNVKILERKGGLALKQGPASLTVPIEGSAMRVSLWAGSAPAAQAEESDSLIIMIGGVAVLVLAALGAVVLLRKRRANAADLELDLAADSQRTVAGIDALRSQVSASAQGALPPTADDDETAAQDAALAQGSVLSDEIFRAYDVRGVVGKTLTVDVVKKLGLAIGSEAYDRGQQTLCVARDGRASSPELAAALIEGLRASGRDVIDVGEVPTPVLYFSTYYLETRSGVMITGSHNPPDYNGLKIMLGGDTLFGDDIQALKQRILREELATGAGNLQSMDISTDYIRRVSEDVPVALGNAFKVVIDCGNGVAGNFAPKLLRALGHDVVELFCEVDGNFPNHHPDPSQPENLQDLITAIRDNDADLGFAFDGDGDRLGVVDSTGRIIWPDAQMMLFSRDVLSRNPGAEIVYDVKCSSRLGKVIAKLGGKPVMYKTGHSYIKNKLKETGAPLAGEMSGHIFFKERWYGFDDAMYAAARMLEILMGFKQRPAEVFAKLPAGVSTPELKVEMKEGENLQFMALLSDIEQFADATVSTIDGIRVDWPNRWGLVRASNTTPSLVLRFEGDDEQALGQVKDTFRKLLLEKKPDLSLPF